MRKPTGSPRSIASFPFPRRLRGEQPSEGRNTSPGLPAQLGCETGCSKSFGRQTQYVGFVQMDRSFSGGGFAPPICGVPAFTVLHRVNHRAAEQVNIVRNIGFGGANLAPSEHAHLQGAIDQLGKRHPAALNDIVFQDAAMIVAVLPAAIFRCLGPAVGRSIAVLQAKSKFAVGHFTVMNPDALAPGFFRLNVSRFVGQFDSSSLKRSQNTGYAGRSRLSRTIGHGTRARIRISATNASRSPPEKRKPGNPAASAASISVERSPMTKLPARRTGQCCIRSRIMPGLGFRQWWSSR